MSPAKKPASKKSAPKKTTPKKSAKPSKSPSIPQGATLAQDMRDRGLTDDQNENVLTQAWREGRAAFNTLLMSPDLRDLVGTKGASAQARATDNESWYNLTELARSIDDGSFPAGEWVTDNGEVYVRRGIGSSKKIPATQLRAWLTASMDGKTHTAPDGEPLAPRPSKRVTKQRDLEGNVKERPIGLRRRVVPAWRVLYEHDHHEAAFVKNQIKAITGGDDEEDQLFTVERNLKATHKVPPSGSREKERAEILADILEDGKDILAEGQKIAPEEDGDDE